LTLEVPVFGDTDVSFFVLLLRLLELDLVDFDAVLRVLEVRVDGEGVRFVDLFALGVLGERAKLGAGEGLECTLDFGLSCE